jgi:predicted transposase YbfD/YdcC
MATISPEAMSELLVMWADLVTNNKKEKLRKIFNIDGKTIRGNRSKSQKPLHIVSAFSKDDGVCYGQTAVNKKSNEITAIPALLDTLKVENCIITIDAAGTYTNIAEKIISKKCDYCLAVKKNQKTLYEDIIPYFQDEKSLEEIYKKGDCYQTIEKARGGLEQRDYYILSELDWLKKEHPEWPKLESIGMTTNTITREGKATKQTRFYIQSFKCSPEEFARTVRDHWAIESMHWLLDVVFREDANKTLNQTAAQNLNILRKLSLAILKTLDLGKKMSYRRKRFNIALKFEEMIEELFNL